MFCSGNQPPRLLRMACLPPSRVHRSRHRSRGRSGRPGWQNGRGHRGVRGIGEVHGRAGRVLLWNRSGMVWGLGHDAIGLIWCNFGGTNGGNFLDSAWKSFWVNHFGLMFAPVRSWGYWILSGHRWKPEICHEVAKKCYRSRCGWQWWRW